MNSKVNMVETHEQVLPDDLVREILSHLPVWTIIKFSTVCKSWKRIISSPSFAQLHLQNYCNTPITSTTNDNSCVFVRTFDNRTRILKVSMMLPGRPSRELSLDAEFGRDCQSGNGLELVGTVNGLICIYGIGSRERFALCNPYLGETETLPRPPTLCGDASIFNRAGLGFDPVRKEIKVVRLLCLLNNMVRRVTFGVRVDIYSRNTKTWARLTCDVPRNTWAMEPISTSDNGGLFCHWLAFRDQDDSGSTYVVLSFDVFNEVFQITQLPHIISDTSTVKIKVFGKGDSLVLFSWYLHGPLFAEGSDYLDMWMLSGLGREGHWVPMAAIGPLVHLSKPVCLWKSHGLILNDMTTRSFVIYDYYTHEIINSDIMGGEQYNPNVLEYKGSLVSLDK